MFRLSSSSSTGLRLVSPPSTNLWSCIPSPVFSSPNPLSFRRCLAHLATSPETLHAQPDRPQANHVVEAPGDASRRLIRVSLPFACLGLAPVPRATIIIVIIVKCATRGLLWMKLSSAFKCLEVSRPLRSSHGSPTRRDKNHKLLARFVTNSKNDGVIS